MNSTIKWPSWILLNRHWLSLVGVALVTTAVISWLFVLPLRIRGHVDHPYVGIVIFLLLPALFSATLGDRRDSAALFWGARTRRR